MHEIKVACMSLWRAGRKMRHGNAATTVDGGCGMGFSGLAGWGVPCRVVWCWNLSLAGWLLALSACRFPLACCCCCCFYCWILTHLPLTEEAGEEAGNGETHGAEGINEGGVACRGRWVVVTLLEVWREKVYKTRSESKCNRQRAWVAVGTCVLVRVPASQQGRPEPESSTHAGPGKPKRARGGAARGTAGAGEVLAWHFDLDCPITATEEYTAAWLSRVQKELWSLSSDPFKH